MEKNKKVKARSENLFVIYRDEITPAYQRAVREAVLRHRRNGQSIAIARDGEVVILQPDEIEAELERATRRLESGS